MVSARDPRCLRRLADGQSTVAVDRRDGSTVPVSISSEFCTERSILVQRMLESTTRVAHSGLNDLCDSAYTLHYMTFSTVQTWVPALDPLPLQSPSRPSTLLGLLVLYACLNGESNPRQLDPLDTTRAREITILGSDHFCLYEPRLRLTMFLGLAIEPPNAVPTRIAITQRPRLRLTMFLGLAIEPPNAVPTRIAITQR
nr:hypothetical protein CFP56_31022 [Quercus suber]